MTKHTQVELALSLKDVQKQQPFEIVLIDIKMAAGVVNNEIYCVKKPLNDKNLKYVALSYRWGELKETLIDTKLGYIASVTSFDLADFYNLCSMMTRESDLKDIRYVWVDAICVDQRPAKRKATIYQMSNIYEQATYILAVPDLHKAYLENTSIKNQDIMDASYKYHQDIYYLIHGNSDKLASAEDEFLDEAKVPTDPILRQSLKKYTDYFTDGFMKYKKHHNDYCSKQALDHICEVTGQFVAYPTPHHQTQDKKYSLEDLHHCHQVICPLSVFEDGQYRSDETDQLKYGNWNTKIIERSNSIRQAMDFLADLIFDWSSRVWVISEFNIAKKKNNLKFWFIHLGTPPYENTFFKFDFDSNHSFPSVVDHFDIYSIDKIRHTRRSTSNPVYFRFHSIMLRQLKQQSFLEMDRFYAIMPLSKYKHILSDRNKVDQWNITTLTDIKLKLYEIMNTKDKLNLLFWSGNECSSNQGIVLPTFATSTVSSDTPTDAMVQFSVDAPCNFDLTDPSTITLHHDQINNNNENDDEEDDHLRDVYCLCLKPMEYYVVQTDDLHDTFDEELDQAFWYPLDDEKARWALGQCETQWERLGMDDIHPNPNMPATTAFYPDIVAIDTCVNTSKQHHDFIILVGSLKENKWSLGPAALGFRNSFGEPLRHYDGYGEVKDVGFNIY